MCRAGGPRCKGSGGGRRSGSSAVATAERDESAVGSPTPSGAPTREDTDRLAALLPDSRTGWDGQPLDDRARRLYALRESGWSGPIDQDGYPDTTSDAADTLRYMARQRGENPDW
jgi:hypothetical protein